MPQRFLRPGIRTSALWNQVSWKAQSLYIRILTLVDDYGRYDGRASVLWGECFAVWNEHHPADQVTMEDTCSNLQQLADTGLIEIYTPEKPILQITRWQERVRAGIKEKWPISGDPVKVAASCSKLLPSSPSSSSSIIERVGASRLSLVVEVFDAWNAQADNLKLPKCLHVSDKRRRFVEARGRDTFFTSNWRAALAKLQGSAFCKGVNDRGWRATFDWFIQPDTVPKIMEGKYDHSQAHQRVNPRNQGVARAGIDYGEAAKRKLEQQMAKAGNPPASPPAGNGA